MPKIPLRTVQILLALFVTTACTANGKNETPTTIAGEPPPAKDSTMTPCPLGADSVEIIRDKRLLVEPSAEKPIKGQYYRDPVFGTCVVRVTDHRAEPPNGFARHDYARRQAFNADDTRMLIYALDGYWHIYDANTLKYIKLLRGPAGDAEPQWHPSDPRFLYFLPNNGGMTIHLLNVESGKLSTVADFSGRLPWPDAARAWTRSEGSPSADARYWAFQVEDEEFKGLGLMTYDLAEDRLIATLDFRDAGLGRPDHVSMSASGRYVMAAFPSPFGTLAFNRDLTNRRQILSEITHGDTAIGPDGQDMFVYAHWADVGWIRAYDFESGRQIDLTRIYLGNRRATSLHVSGRSLRKPGWALISTYAESGPPGWHNRRIFAIELANNPQIASLGHTRVTNADYWSEPQATVNRDFSRVLFNSNWESDDDKDVDTYLIEVPGAALANP